MFLLLPPELKQKVAEFCTADDVVLSLSLTCKAIHRELKISVLSTPYEFFSNKEFAAHADSANQGVLRAAVIPVFFAKYCHSVRFNCFVQLGRITNQTHESAWTFYVVARPKRRTMGASSSHALSIRNELGQEGTIVWQSPLYMGRHNVSFFRKTIDVTFGCDENHRYFFWYQCEGRGASHQHLWLNHFKVDRLLVWDDSQHMRKQIYDKYMEIDQNLRDAGSKTLKCSVSRCKTDLSLFCSPCPQFTASAFFAKLFALSLETIDMEQSNTNHPIKTLLESNECGGTTWKKLDTRLLMALKCLATVYLQLLEKEELQLLEREEGAMTSDWSWEPMPPTVTDDDSTTTHLVTLPPIPLVSSFGWREVNSSSVSININDTMEEAEQPRFVTRIPVPHGTKSFRLRAKAKSISLTMEEPEPPWALTEVTYVTRTTFLLFAKMPKDYSVTNLSTDRSIEWDPSSIRPDFHLIWHETADGDDLNVVLDVLPAAKAYFLYVLPGNGPESFESLRVQLSVFDDENKSKLKVFDKLLGLLGLKEKHKPLKSFHLGLLNAVAETLILYEGPYALPGSPRSAQSLVALTGLLEAEGFPLDKKDALECLAQLTDEMLQYHSPPYYKSTSKPRRTGR